MTRTPGRRIIIFERLPIVERLVEGGCVLKHFSHILYIGHVPIVRACVTRTVNGTGQFLPREFSQVTTAGHRDAVKAEDRAAA